MWAQVRGGGGGGREGGIYGVSANEYLYTGTQINFGDLSLYLTNAYEWLSIYDWFSNERYFRFCKISL